MDLDLRDFVDFVARWRGPIEAVVAIVALFLIEDIRRASTRRKIRKRAASIVEELEPEIMAIAGSAGARSYDLRYRLQPPRAALSMLLLDGTIVCAKASGRDLRESIVLATESIRIHCEAMSSSAAEHEEQRRASQTHENTGIHGDDAWWTVLGIEQKASLTDIDSAYKEQAKKHHPDCGGSKEMMACINRARDEARTYVGLHN